MECFLAVVQEMHFRRAADRLRLSPASVSEAVSSLERSLGGQLFERTSRRVRLTPLGAEFAASIRQPIDDLHRAHQEARRQAASHRAAVVAHTPELGQLILPRLVANGSDDSLDAAGLLPAWRPVAMHTPRQLTAVADGEIDVGLCWSVPQQPGIESAVLGEFPLVAVLRSSDPLASHAEVSLTQLRSRQLLVTPRADNPYLDSQLQADVTRSGIPRAHIEEVARYDELVVHVAARGHVGIHPGPIALTSTLPSVVFRPIADASDRVRICAISHSGERSPATTSLIESLSTIVASLDLESAFH